MDSELSFQEHIASKVAKANSLLGVLRRTFRYFDSETFCMLYKAIVRPHLEFAQAVWHPYLQRDIDAIEKVQRRATKLILWFRNLDYEERLK